MNEPLIKKGWLRALMFLVLWLMLKAGLVTIFNNVLLPLTGLEADDITLKLLLLTSTSLLLDLPATFAFLRLIDRKDIASLGFAWGGYQNHAASGILAGLLPLAIGTLILLISGTLQFIDVQFPVKDIALSAAIMLFVAFSEEIIIRGYILNNLLESFPHWVAWLISSAIFALLHINNPGGFAVLSMAGVFAGGLLLGINYAFTKNLWFGIFLHFTWNFIQGPVLGYKVSGMETDTMLTQVLNGPAWLTGGEFGFEGSILSVVLILIVVLFLYHRYTLKNTSYR